MKAATRDGAAFLFIRNHFLQEKDMKEYPSITKNVVQGEKIYAFDKLDGSNIRAEWNKKNKFWKFGTRTRLVDRAEKPWGEAIDLIIGKYEKDLHDIFVDNRFQEVISFFEFFGPNSFAGNHAEEPHEVKLFDIRVHKKGIIEPNEYLKLVGKLDIAKLLYYGNANQPFIESVQNRTLNGMTFEGVVCKGQLFRPGLPLMFKIKSYEWLEKLKGKCEGNQKLFEELA